ncbi:MAG: hypothetical protein COB93_04780 [Sneathiella sp.]|nr:MAG: hypothetical protein COB93_04780 [Sneathiella sp.]
MEVLKPTANIIRLPIPSEWFGAGAHGQTGTPVAMTAGQDFVLSGGLELSTRKRHVAPVDDIRPQLDNTTVFERKTPTPSSTSTGINHLAPGQSSPQFLAQQIAQAHDSPNILDAEYIHTSAARAYDETHGLTAVVLGFDGYQQRVA